MPSNIRNEEFDVLIWEISSTPHRRLLHALGTTNPVIGAFPDCPAVVAFLHDTNADPEAKDRVLAAILQAHAQDKNPRWRSVLLAAFWPGLDSLHMRRAHWDQDPGEVWQDLITTFLEVLCRLNLTRRTDRFAQKIINDTIHRLHDRYQRRWRLEAPEKSMPASDMPQLSDVRAEPSRQDERLFLQDLQQRGAAILGRLLDAGVIDQIDMEILVGTYLHGLSITDVASRLGIALDCARKRRQRIERMLRAENPASSCPIKSGLRGLLLGEPDPVDANHDCLVNTYIKGLRTMTKTRSKKRPQLAKAPPKPKRSSVTAAHRLLCLAQVTRHPGQTSAEIADGTGLDRHTASRRLPELREAGLVVNGPNRICTMQGRRSVTWILDQEATP